MKKPLYLNLKGFSPYILGTFKIKNGKFRTKLKNETQSNSSRPLSRGHPLLSGHLTKSRKSFLLITVKLTCIKQSPVLRGRGHLYQVSNKLFLIVFTSIKRSLSEEVPCILVQQVAQCMASSGL